MSVVGRNRPWLRPAIVLAVVALIAALLVTWRMSIVPRGRISFLPAHTVEAKKWRATIPGVGEIHLVAVTDPAAPIAQWWTPDGRPTANPHPGDPNDELVDTYRRKWPGDQCRTLKFEFVDGLPKDFELAELWGPEWCVSAGSSTSSQNRFANACCLEMEFGEREDFLFGIAVGKPTLIATKAWPHGNVEKKGKWAKVAVEPFAMPKGQRTAQLMVETSKDLNEGRITVVAKDAKGRNLDCRLDPYLKTLDFVRESRSGDVYEQRRRLPVNLRLVDYNRLASVEVYWTPYRWVVFRDVALRAER